MRGSVRMQLRFVWSSHGPHWWKPEWCPQLRLALVLSFTDRHQLGTWYSKKRARGEPWSSSELKPSLALHHEVVAWNFHFYILSVSKYSKPASSPSSNRAPCVEWAELSNGEQLWYPSANIMLTGQQRQHRSKRRHKSITFKGGRKDRGEKTTPIVLLWNLSGKVATATESSAVDASIEVLL